MTVLRFPVFLFCLLSASVLASNHFFGITTSNSVGGANPYKCRTQAQWNKVASDAKSQGFHAIRIDGFDCNALEMASSAAASQGLQVLAGIYVSGTFAGSSAQIDNDVEIFRLVYKRYGGARYVGLAIGNESIDSPSNIAVKINAVKAHLKSVGVNTPVSTVHTWVKIRDNHCLCSADFVGANAHAFYDGSVTSSQAGAFLFKTVVPALKAACPGKKIYITASGWPSNSANNGRGIASKADEQNALSSLNCASQEDPSVSIFAFEYDNQPWKLGANEGSFGIFVKVPLQDVFRSC